METLSTTLATSTNLTFNAILEYNNRCRYRDGYLQPPAFKLLTCALCFKYVFNDADVHIMPSNGTVALVTGYDTSYPPDTYMIPNVENETESAIVCGSLKDPGACWKWEECCQAASSCCDQQLADGPRPFQEYYKTICPRTWDGYSCFRDTPGGKTVYLDCPDYVTLAGDSDGSAHKTCRSNGTWYTHHQSKLEWTDYGGCQNLKEFERIHAAGVACNIITIVFLVPACIIFVYFKPLRQQHRIRLHLCLMLSALVHSVSKLLWEIIIFKDRMHTSDMKETVLYQNSVGCRFLNMATRYTLTANFMWMFIEGFHLHRLLVHAFSAPKSLIPYYLIGFGFPLLPVTAYIIARGVTDHLNVRCWSHQAGSYEWILYTPILAVLLFNVFFLLRIVFIMVKQLEPHPNEPSHFRRAAKAVGVLVPLFGVQFLLFVYRPQGSAFARVFELLNVIVSSLQGTFIAILFCYNNKEVQGHLRTVFLRALRSGGYRGRDVSMRGGSVTMTSQFTADATRSRFTNGNGESSHMIPLRRISEQIDTDFDSIQNGPEANGGPIGTGYHDASKGLLKKNSSNV